MLASSRSEKEKAMNVKVLLRCRPFSEDKLLNNAPQVITCNEFQKDVAVSQAIARKQFDRVFTFDKALGRYILWKESAEELRMDRKKSYLKLFWRTSKKSNYHSWKMEKEEF
ncbi:putative 125 kDa kinesin-related protein [Dendrobium catenatum]|uniref:Putative 125 kDa kinesin-related protein n=1 Tax=Dendrobium catenatum TaxID=906689 RepID=A0A2I0VZ66_9ASPA|nr:putative 125 kDa kinesin-related protein [Dendrobium catenatum]